jgi:four helix bundle protein
MTVRVKSRDYRKLLVWEKAHRLVLDAYQVTKDFPDAERFGMTSQIRRSAASVPANIAEGCGRGGNELARSIRIALGEISEFTYHILLAHDLGMIDDSTYQRLNQRSAEVQRMLSSFADQLTEERLPDGEFPGGAR